MRSIALTRQLSLFSSATSVDDRFRSLERTVLEGECWIDLCPGWISGADAAFDDLVATVDWGQRRRWMYSREVDEPRLTSWQRVEGGQTMRPDWLERARCVLSDRYDVAFDSAGLNLYRHGGDSVAWHRDRIPEEVADPIVALVSLGEPRKFLLRKKGGGRSRVFRLGEGDLLVTGGQTQRRYEHTVPKVATAGPRISVAFRHGVTYLGGRR